MIRKYLIYTQIIGSTDELCKFEDETFDMIICHNVFEYAMDGYKDIAFFHHLTIEKR